MVIPERWPGGARLALSLVIAFERWSGDKVEPGRHVGPVLPPDVDVRDWGSLSWQDYEGRAGLPRLTALCARYGVKATGIFNTLQVEAYPEVARAFAEDGHEICAHSRSQDTRMWKLDERAERELILECRELIEAHTGFRPVGWLSPGGQPSDHTRRLLAVAGYRYHSDLVDDDVPYMADVPGGARILAFPYDWEVNDMAIYARGLNAPETYASFFRDKFDVLYEESEQRPMILNFTIHSRLFGRPAGSMALRRCLEYALAHDDVAFLTRQEIAEACWATVEARHE